jgi:rfaE bifunctional protein kinase chain/domain
LHETPAGIRKIIPAGKQVAFVSGNFNIVHPGHLRLLKFAADMADVLVLGLQPDSTPGVTVKGDMRLEGVRALSLVDHAFLMSEEVESVIATLRPTFVVKGKEFENRFNVEAAAVESYGGTLIFSSGDVQFASIDLLRHEFTDSVATTIRGAEGYPERHQLDTGTLRQLVRKMALGMRVAVVGDIIVDDYITCDPLGMSQEDPTIVVTPIETRTFVGGAGVVAAHAHNLGAQVDFFTVLGADETAAFARAELNRMGVDVHGIADVTRPTTRKQRFRALNKTLLRVNHLRQHDVSKDIADKLIAEIEAVLPEIDLLMFSDFNYGCLPQNLVDAVSASARRHGVMMTADSQASSQISDISRFKGMALVTPTEREARLALRDTASGLAVLAQDLQTKADAVNVIITLGEEGMLIRGGDREGIETIADQLPALNSAPKDVAGAGDSLFTATSMALCSGADIWSSAYLGGVAAACQVSRVGNSPLKISDILVELDQIDRLV